MMQAAHLTESSPTVLNLIVGQPTCHVPTGRVVYPSPEDGAIALPKEYARKRGKQSFIMTMVEEKYP